MQIIQLIDSLETGGAERMAVNYANALQSKIEFSGLVATRTEGSLKAQINPKVSYLFLNKTKTIDLQATKKLYQYCKTNKIQFIHAHSSSYFLAVLIKLLLPKTKIIWHIHNGNIINNTAINFYILKTASFFFSYSISVNKNIHYWVLKNKLGKKCIYFENFTSKNENPLKQTTLIGKKSIKILQLANLKNPKNHNFTIEIAKIVVSKYPDCSFHLVGKDFNDAYSMDLKTKIKANNLENHVFIYGSKNDTDYIISQADICILTSVSEGLPVALIEYGMHKKPVVCTAVGEIPNIIINQKNGYLAPSNNVIAFTNNLLILIENENQRNDMAQEFYKTIYEEYSEKKVINKYLDWIET